MGIASAKKMECFHHHSHVKYYSLKLWIISRMKIIYQSIFFLSPTHYYVISFPEVWTSKNALFKPEANLKCIKSLRNSWRFFEGVFHVIWVILKERHITVIWKSTQITSKKFQGQLQTFLRHFSHYIKVRIKSRDEIIQK